MDETYWDELGRNSDCLWGRVWWRQLGHGWESRENSSKLEPIPFFYLGCNCPEWFSSSDIVRSESSEIQNDRRGNRLILENIHVYSHLALGCRTQPEHFRLSSFDVLEGRRGLPHVLHLSCFGWLHRWQLLPLVVRPHFLQMYTGNRNRRFQIKLSMGCSGVESLWPPE